MKKLGQKTILQRKQVTFVKHTKQWFINNVGKTIFTRYCVLNTWSRYYIKIDSETQAWQLYVHQNVSGRRYFI